MRGIVRLLTISLVLSPVAPAMAGKEAKAKKPHLELRAAPRMGTSPASIFFTAELKDGADLEEFHCPSLEWDWDDGAKSTHEADCAAYDPATPIERRFTAEHLFSHEGSYDVKVTMRRADQVIAMSRVQITIRPGAGDMTGASYR